MRTMNDNSQWLELGTIDGVEQCSRVCGRLVQISDGFLRDALYEDLSQFGGVVAIYLDVVVRGD
eukprot:6132072-Karenia_brevis.AAC.1